MKISADLARLNRERFQAFDADQPGTKQAALAFAGEVYRGLEAGTLDDDDLAYAQDHLRILSGLYGLLRPGDKIARHLNELQAGDSDPVVLNLASNEYFKAVDQKALKARVITASFKEEKDGQARMLMVFAKKARGMMARWAIENRISDPADLVKFDAGGYTYDEVGSSESDLLFTRPQPAAAGAKAKAEA